MPQDPNLYGQRAPKRQKKETALPSSLAFTAELSSLISTSRTPASTSTSASTSRTGTARPRPSKSKTDDIFAGVRAKRKAERQERDRDDGKLVLKEVATTEEEKNALIAARRRMEEKARLYAAMKRGDYVPKEGDAAPLVDFDRKWAEAQQAQEDKKENGAAPGSTSSSSDDDEEEELSDDNIDREIITFLDDLGRTRTGTRADRLRMERRLRARAHGAAELEHMSARPAAPAPERLILGDAVQTAAFRAADGDDAMARLAARRDRSPTPPPAVHYDAGREIRTKGVGFFRFSRDEAARAAEMESLARERAATERAREQQQQAGDAGTSGAEVGAQSGGGKESRAAAARRREVEERRRLIEERRRAAGEKRARKMADTFLEGLAVDLGSGGDGRGKDEAEGG